VRNILLGLALFAGLIVYVHHSFGPQPRAVSLARKLRVVGVMTWLYALVQIADMPSGTAASPSVVVPHRESRRA